MSTKTNEAKQAISIAERHIREFKNEVGDYNTQWKALDALADAVRKLTEALEQRG